MLLTAIVLCPPDSWFSISTCIFLLEIFRSSVWMGITTTDSTAPHWMGTNSAAGIELGSDNWKRWSNGDVEPNGDGHCYNSLTQRHGFKFRDRGCSGRRMTAAYLCKYDIEI